MLDEDVAERFTVELTRTGIPCLWECGGGMTNTGWAQVICAIDGSPKKAIYVRQYGHLALREHALIPVQKWDVIVKAHHHRGDFRISLWQVFEICKESDDAYLNARMTTYWDGFEWTDPDVAEKYKVAVQAAKEKATCYHCREPHFVKQE